MGVKMMRWRPWPPLISKKFDVKLVVRRLENLGDGGDWVQEGAGACDGASVEIRWKGPPRIALSSFRKTMKRNCTREERFKIGPDGAVLVEWDEEFQSACNLSAHRDNVFHPWEISFTVLLNGFQGAKNKAPTFGIASVNLAEFAAKTEEKEFDINIPLAVLGCSSESHPSLYVSLSLLELRAAQDSVESLQRPVVSATSPPRLGESSSTEKNELSALKAGLRNVKIFTEYVSTRKAKKPCREDDGSDGRCMRSDEGEYAYAFDSESLDEFEEGEPEDGKEDCAIRKSFSYGTLAYANYAGVSFYSNRRISAGDEDFVYYSNRRSYVGSQMEDPIASVPVPPVVLQSKRSILPWRKRKLSFRSPISKGEPLLKAYGEEGGDDIDYDRRQLSSDECVPFGWHKAEEDSIANRSSVSEFGDDSFAVGCWEQNEITSRDGNMKLQARVFFASIDQRSESAAGESACTALVAVIAEWLQSNRDLMPIKSQFDTLIREGSLEWRNLCQDETYRERFPDKHFDLETILQAKIRSISVVPGKSFIGFFHPDGMEDGRFDFLQGAMSFDNIWDEISSAGSECANGEPQVYIVSWNDHFFVLKVEPEAYYIIDTLGERLYEGCNQAYILKFDKDTTIYQLPAPSPQENGISNPDEGSIDSKAVPGLEEPMKTDEKEEILCHGKESCKFYIKNFLAAIPIRELQADIKKALISSTPLHHRLQIEFHFTHLQQ
ncbi:uncharacterized protein LOC115996044 [Ipomoea triloba]|uniref:uncharacterized protein LOC115996044 n=1 Tax=Ipomoea triloba TaxID=35885 RepID=UPI00125E763A|nr:uncharacterized protein LOC115996044 [Ipomoea triloba]